MNNSFVALDFETACYSSLSACSIGLDLFDNGKLVESRHWFLKPVNCGRFSFTRIHGITWEDVKDQSTLEDVWLDIAPYFQNRLIIAHNAIFAMGLLKENLNHYQIEYPDYFYNCTLDLSRKYFPILDNHQLETVCNHLNIAYGKHHAEGDAISCGSVFKYLLNKANNPAQLFNGRQLENKSYLHKGISFKSQKSADLTGISVDDVDGSAELNFFQNKCCVITGNFSCLNRNKLPQQIKDLGGKVSSSVSGKTNYLIMGTEPGWSKVEKVEKMITEGKNMVIMDEAELIQVFDKLKSMNP
ncbi:MAG: exonuclease domain-containing protein [Anditalea sp.]